MNAGSMHPDMKRRNNLVYKRIFGRVKNNKLKNVHNNAIIKYKKGVNLMPQIMPITDLRKTNEISDLCHKNQEPIFITKNGYGDLVVMSIEAYEKLISDAQIDTAISEAEEEVKAGAEPIDAREALSGLRRKYTR